MSRATAAQNAVTEIQITIRSAMAERYEVFPIGAHVIVGRHTSCQLRIESDTISRQHVVLELGPDGMSVEDISTNGTLAGETLLRRESTRVPYGTEISLGDFILTARLTERKNGPSHMAPQGDGGPWGGKAAATAIAPIEDQRMTAPPPGMDVATPAPPQALMPPQAAQQQMAQLAAQQQMAQQQQVAQQVAQIQAMRAMQMQGMPMQGMPMQGMPMQGVPLAPQGIQGLPMQGAPMQGMPMSPFGDQAARQASLPGTPMHNAPMQSAPMQLAQLQAAQLQAAQLQAAQLAGNPQVRPGGGFVSAPGAPGAGGPGMLPVVRVPGGPGGAPGGGPSQAQVAAAQMQAQQQAQQRAQAQMQQQQQPGGANLPPVAGPPQRGARPTTGSVSLPMPRGRNLSPEMLERRRRDIELRRGVHKILLEHLDLATMDPSKLDDPSIRPRVLNALRRIILQLEQAIPPDVDRDQLVGELADEALGLGPLERFLSDPSISEIMVVDPETIYVEKGGRLMLSDARFTDDDRVRAVIERIVTPLGRRIDESSPIVDARLRDGSRVNAIIRPLALRGSCITIRKFARTPLTLERLIELGTLTPPIARFLTRSVIAKKNIVISGGTGSGKTTLLNVLSGAIPAEERIVTIEDAAELQLKQPHVVSLETRPANLEGRGEYTIRDLVKNALRMRPDRIVVGECRGGEALDMLQAMNTGHDGSLTTTHANTPHEAVARLETLSLMSGLDLPSRAIREQIGSSIHLIVQQSRLSDGSRKITAVTEVVGINDEGEVELRPIFEFVRTGTGAGGKVIGEFRATGYLPSYLQEFIVMGLVAPGESYL